MCVIMAAKTKAISPEMIAKGFEANPHGAGIAWRDGQFVRWAKGLNMDDVQKLAASVPLPYVVHFRVPTVGGPSELLTHPFPVQRDVSLALEGKTKGYVLFHNGHWNSWKNDAKEAATKTKGGLPIGKWSDSRALAFVASVYGLGYLEFVDEKVLAFGPQRVEIFGNPWCFVNDVWCSNRSWEARNGMSWLRNNNDKKSEDVDDDINNGQITVMGPAQSPNAKLIADAKARQQTRLINPQVEGFVRTKPSDNNGQGTAAIDRESNGGAPQETPFAKASRELKEAQALHDSNRLSKNKLKKFQRKLDLEARRQLIQTRTAQISNQVTLH